MNTEDYSLTFPISRITEPTVRRALIYSFQDESAACSIIDVLTYLTLSYLGMMRDYKKILEEHEGFMEKSYRDISFFTGLVTASGEVPKREISSFIKCLETAGLIKTARGGFNNAKKIKVNLPELEQYIVKAEESWRTAKEEYLARQVTLRESEIRRRQSNLRKGMRAEDLEDAEVIADRLNRLPDVINCQDYRDALTGTSAETWWRELWLFSCYYEKYTGKPYWWNGLKLGILVSTWKDKPLNERSITTAIFTALNPGFNDYPDFERRFRVHYSTYLREIPEGVIFDNFRNL